MDEQMHDEQPQQPGLTPGETGDTAESAAADARPSRKAAWLAMAAVAAALALIWFAPGLDTHDEGFDSAIENPGDPEDATAAGHAAPLNYTLKDMHGVDVKMSSFRGKIILLNFWATWCGPCRAEIPSLVELQQQYADDLVVLGFSVDDTPDKLKPYAEQFHINYPVLVGNGRQDIQDAFGPLWGIPVSVIIGRDGVIARKHSGIASKEQFEREIKALL